MLSLFILLTSACDKTIELGERSSYQNVSVKRNETICFTSTQPNTVLLFKHLKHFQIGNFVVGKQPRVLQADRVNYNPSHKPNHKPGKNEHHKKTVGYYFGKSLGNLEITASKDSTLQYLYSAFPNQCQNKVISTLFYDAYTLNEDCSGDGCTSNSACFFHARENSTYAVTVSNGEKSKLIATYSNLTFTGKTSDYVRAPLELLFWVPSKEENVTKVEITVGHINLLANKPHCPGFRVRLTGDEPTLIEVECNKDHNRPEKPDKVPEKPEGGDKPPQPSKPEKPGHDDHHHHHDHDHDHHHHDDHHHDHDHHDHDDHHHGHHGHDKDDTNDGENNAYDDSRPKYNYNNVYKKGVMFPSMLFLLGAFVTVFFLFIILGHAVACLIRRGRARRQNRRTEHPLSDIPPVHRQPELAAPLNHPQTVMVPVHQIQQFPVPIQQMPQQMPQQYVVQQPQYVYYPPPSMQQQQMPQYPPQVATVVYPQVRPNNQ
ncbi:hypothetical protein TRFO_24985 [Tritrichomonas foetus]|uniref:Uncharacterized protein n=1 Tax=Tritrichomonas foetus TaxID=1144522 RepID=A0A1J4KB04_9EUKA|nr:hypothetical protein TRFO_24985 [Tritrichomonas foetus]|eukprot:OHT06884.1 hypothetical protein TRFO_24985 [Tritrichomonas foetus]